MFYALRIATTATFAILTLVSATRVASAQQESAEIRRAQKLVDAEKETILFFAHPTATYQSIRFDGSKQLRDGFSLSYTFNWHSDVSDKDHYTELAFYCDRNGKLDFIQAGSTSSLFKPFFGSNTVVSLIKREMQKDVNLQNDRELMKLLQKDSKEILETYLRRDVEALLTVLGPVFGGAAPPAPAPREQPKQVTARKIVTPDAVPNNSELLDLIRKSESMDNDERKYWVEILPVMTADQTRQLRDILVNERDQLAAIDKKYSGPTAQARTLIDKKDYKGAISLLSSAASADGKDTEIFQVRGLAYEYLKEWRLAIDDYTRAIDLSPKSDSVLRRRGYCYGELGEFRREYIDYMRSAELAPKNATACNSVAWLLASCTDAKIRDGIEALQFATRACEISDWKEPLFLDTLAAACAELGQYPKAVQWQQKALANPDFEKNVSKDGFAVAQRRLELYKAGQAYRGR